MNQKVLMIEGKFEISTDNRNLKRNPLIKFSFSEKATKIMSYHPLDLTFT